MGGYLSAMSEVKIFGDNAVEALKTMGLIKRIITTLANWPHCKRPRDVEDLQGHIFCQHLRANQDLAELALFMLVALIITSLLLICVCYFRAKKVVLKMNERITNQHVNVNTRLSSVNQSTSEVTSRAPARSRPPLETRVDFEEAF